MPTPSARQKSWRKEVHACCRLPGQPRPPNREATASGQPRPPNRVGGKGSTSDCTSHPGRDGFEEECQAQLGVELDTLEAAFWVEVGRLAEDALPAGKE